MVKFGAPKGNGGPGHDPAAAAFHVAQDYAAFMVPRMELDPTVIFLGPEDKMGMATLTGPKSAYGPATADILRKFGCQWYVYVMEAWVTTRNTPLPRGTKVSDLPLDDREEWVIIFLVRKGRGIELAERARVQRYRDQRRLESWEITGDEYKVLSGLMPMDW